MLCTALKFGLLHFIFKISFIYATDYPAVSSCLKKTNKITNKNNLKKTTVNTREQEYEQMIYEEFFPTPLKHCGIFATFQKDKYLFEKVLGVTVG